MLVNISKVIERCPHCGQILRQSGIAIASSIIICARICDNCSKTFTYVETPLDDAYRVTVTKDK